MPIFGGSLPGDDSDDVRPPNQRKNRLTHCERPGRASPDRQGQAYDPVEPSQGGGPRKKKTKIDIDSEEIGDNDPMDIDDGVRESERDPLADEGAVHLSGYNEEDEDPTGINSMLENRNHEADMTEEERLKM
jgi:hypothetical protein